MVSVVDDGSSKAPGRVDASSGDGDGGQVDEENSKADGKRSQNLQHQTYNLVTNNAIELHWDDCLILLHHTCNAKVAEMNKASFLRYWSCLWITTQNPY